VKAKVFEAATAKGLQMEVDGFLKASMKVHHVAQSEALSHGGTGIVRHVTLTVFYDE
jgi:hypothetical protein